MVEEKKDLKSEEQAEDEASTGSQIVAFLVTLVSIPFLFAGACIGVFFLNGSRHFLVFEIVFFALFIFFAIRTKSPGVRWGIIVMGAFLAFLLMTFR